MKRTTLLWGFLFVSALLVLTGCRDTPTEPDETVPSPEVRATADIEVPVDTIPPGDDPTLYYLLFDGQNEAFDEDDTPDTILRSLTERDIALHEAWYPIMASVEVECMAPRVYPALVVQLDAPDDDIQQLGFVSNPSPNIPNCGVEEFEYYQFE